MNNRNWKYIPWVVIALLAISCKQSPEDILTGGDYKYWTFSGYHHSTFYEYYDKAGKHIHFAWYHHPKGEFREYDFGDEILPEDWRMEGDSILVKDGFTFRIVELTGSIMILDAYPASRYDTLYATPIEEIPKDFRRRMR